MSRPRAASPPAARAVLAVALRVVSAVLPLLLAFGCGKNRVTPPVVGAQLPPQVVEVYPAARAERVPYDLPEMWVSFSEDLDSTTVNASNVFLKRDTRRSAVSVRWDAANRRIRIRPLAPLELSDTYTIELQPELETEAGVPLGAVYWWQFSVAGLRRIEHPYPPTSITTASPFTPLAWDRTEASAGEVVYDLYVGPDSSAVAARAVTPQRRTVADLIPYPTTWGYARRYYWSVTARNLTRNEVEEGPVWSFETMPAGAPMDSVLVRSSFYNYFDARLNRTFCMDTRMIVGTQYQAVMRFNLAGVMPGRSVAAARLVLTLVVGTVPPPTSIMSTRQPVPTNCALSGTGAPLAQNTLAGNTNFGTSCYFMSDGLTAHVAAMHLGLPSAHGFTFISTSMGATFGVPADMMVYFYR